MKNKKKDEIQDKKLEKDNMMNKIKKLRPMGDVLEMEMKKKKK